MLNRIYILREHMMRIFVIGLMLIMIGTVGCTNSKKAAVEETEITENIESVNVIMEAIGCNEISVKRIVETLDSLQIGELESAILVEDEEGNNILVTNIEGKKYSLGIDKKNYLFSVKDLDNDKYLLEIYE